MKAVIINYRPVNYDIDCLFREGLLPADIC